MTSAISLPRSNKEPEGGGSATVGGRQRQPERLASIALRQPPRTAACNRSERRAAIGEDASECVGGCGRFVAEMCGNFLDAIDPARLRFEKWRRDDQRRNCRRIRIAAGVRGAVGVAQVSPRDPEAKDVRADVARREREREIGAVEALRRLVVREVDVGRAVPTPEGEAAWADLVGDEISPITTRR